MTSYDKHLQEYHSKIIAELKKGTSIKRICSKFSTNIEAVKDLAESENVDTTKSFERYNRKRKERQEKEEIKTTKTKLESDVKVMLLSKLYNYIDIAKQLKITEDKVKRIAVKNGIDLKKEKRQRIEKIIQSINEDIKAGISYKELHKKYRLGNTRITGMLRQHGLGAVYKIFKEKRDKQVLELYKSGKRAKDLMNDESLVSNSFQKKFSNQATVYNICSALGYKKHSKIGKRIDGGTFETIKNLKFIKRCKEKDKMTFKQIAEELKKKGAKTITGKEFSMANVVYKYKKALEKGI